MKFRLQDWIPALLLLISLIIHLSLISKGPVSVDCLNLAINSKATLLDHHLHYLEGSGYPLMVLLGSIFIAAGKCIGIADPVVAVNFVSVVFSSFAILTLYLLVKKICDPLTAILASTILLFNPIFLDISIYGMSHAPALCFLLLGLLSLLRFQTNNKTSDLLLCSLCLGFMGATRLQDLIVTLPAITFVFFIGLKKDYLQKPKHKLLNYILFLILISLIIFLFHLPYLTFDHTNYMIQSKNYWKLNLTNSFIGSFPRPILISITYLIKAFNIVGIICFMAGLYYTAALNKRLLVLIILWWIIPLNLYGNIITSSPRFYSILLPVIIIPISIYLSNKLREKNKLSKMIAMLVFLVIILVPLFQPLITFIRRHNISLISDYYR